MVTPGQKWYNELDSKMEITSVDAATGVFGGRYCSRVGEAEYWYVLTGRQDTDGNTLGWTVNWHNSTSTLTPSPPGPVNYSTPRAVTLQY